MRWASGGRDAALHAFNAKRRELWRPLFDLKGGCPAPRRLTKERTPIAARWTAVGQLDKTTIGAV
jgi:hypothetical protein